MQVSEWAGAIDYVCMCESIHLSIYLIIYLSINLPLYASINNKNTCIYLCMYLCVNTTCLYDGMLMQLRMRIEQNKFAKKLSTIQQMCAGLLVCERGNITLRCGDFEQLINV